VYQEPDEKERKMKIWSRIVNTLYVIAGIFLAFSFLTVWATGGNGYLDKLIKYIKDNLSEFGIIGMLLVVIGIVWVVNWFDYIYRTKVVSFDNPGGKIKISLRAIEDYINSMLKKQMQGIRSLRVKTGLSSKGLETRITLRLYANLNIPETCSTIQELTKDYLQDSVGVDRISNIEVFVTSIKADGEKIKTEVQGEDKDDLYKEANQ
jgi:uncharacterized alkaline shock family protein YloU